MLVQQKIRATAQAVIQRGNAFLAYEELGFEAVNLPQSVQPIQESDIFLYLCQLVLKTPYFR